MLLPRSLVLLKMLELRGIARRVLKQMKRPAGAIFVLLYLCMFLPGILNGLFIRRPPTQLSPEWVLRGATIFIALLCVLAMLAPETRITMNFKPAEVDVLFTGPYSRRQILTYKLIGVMMGSLFMALVMFLATFAIAPWRLQAFVGMYLAFLFSAMFSTAYSMLIQAVSVRVKYLGYLVAAGVVGAVGYATFAVSNDLANAAALQRDPALLAEYMFAHPIIRWMSVPALPFAHVLAADGSFTMWCVWGVVSCAIIVTLYFLVIALDADYMESAIAHSAKQYATLERIKRGQFISTRAVARSRRWSLPSLPRWGGFGPVVWRQLTGVAHAWGRGIAILFVLCVGGGIVVRQYDIHETVRDASLPGLMGVLIYLSLIATNFFRFDFRSDIDVMDGLKTLPISARCMAAAQIVAPASLLAAVYIALGLGTAIAVGRWSNAVVVGLLSIPFAALWMAVENLTFLLWPTRATFQSNMDVQHVGRNLFAFAVKGLFLMPAWAIAAGAGLVSGFLLESWTLAYVVAAFVLALETALMVPAIAGAFERYDPSTDTPP